LKRTIRQYRLVRPARNKWHPANLRRDLAASGVRYGNRATTHRRFAAKLQAMYPDMRVDGDRIFLDEAGVRP